MKKILLALTVVLALNSCGIYGKYDATTSVDNKLYGDVVGEGLIGISQGGIVNEALILGNISWREIFKDAKLQSLIERALEQNSDLRTAMLSVESAQTALKVSRLAYLPSLSVAAQGSLSGLIDSGTSSTKSYTVPLTSSWEIDLFGKLRNDKLRAKMVVEQTEYIEQAVRTQIVAAVVNLYYTLSLLDSQIEITTLTLSSWGESLEASRAMKEAGLMNEAGLAQIEAGELGVKSALLSLVQARKESENALCSILAQSPQAIECGELSDVTIPTNLSLGVPLHILSTRPDVMAAEAALAASFYSENMARSAMYPSITLSGTLGWTNTIGTAIVDPAEFVYEAVASLVQPIFARGANRAQLQIAKNSFEQSRIAFSQSLIDAGIEVNNSISKLTSTEAQAEYYTLQVASLEKAEQSTRLLMEHGNITYLDVLTAQQSLYSAQLQRANNEYDQLTSLVALYTALGGGRF